MKLLELLNKSILKNVYIDKYNAHIQLPDSANSVFFSLNKVTAYNIAKEIKNTLGINAGVLKRGGVWYDRNLAKDDVVVQKIVTLLKDKFNLIVSQKPFDTKIFPVDIRPIQKEIEDQIKSLFRRIKLNLKNIKLIYNKDTQAKFIVTLSNNDEIEIFVTPYNVKTYYYNGKRYTYLQEIIDVIEKELLSIIELYKKYVDNHDWTYEFSDDFRYYKSGQANLKNIAKLVIQMSPIQQMVAWKYWNMKAEKAVDVKALDLRYRTINEFVKTMENIAS